MKYLTNRYFLNTIFSLVLLILNMFYIEHNLHGAVDDSYITYRYASNLIEHGQLTFNIGEYYYGSTAMGYALILALMTVTINLFTFLTGFTIEIYQVGVILSSFSITAISLLVYKIFSIEIRGNVKSTIFTLAITLYLFTAYQFNMVPGHETYTYLALLFMASFYIVFRKEFIIGSIILGIAVLMRPDALLFAMIMYVYILLEKWLFYRSVNIAIKKTLVISLPFIFIVLTWLLFLYSYFGSALPGTMLAKKAQIILGYWGKFTFHSSFEKLIEFSFIGFIFVLVALLVYMVFNFKEILLNKKNLLYFSIIWLLFGLGLQSSYTLFHVSLWNWYVTPVYFAYLLVIISIASILMTSEKSVYKIIFLIMTIILLSLNFKNIKETYSYWPIGENNNTHTISYLPIVKYLKKHEPNGTTIAIAEPGAFACSLGSKYKVVDTLGLISPGVAKSIIQKNKKYLYEVWNPKYVVVSWEGDYNANNEQWFKQRYTLIGEFHHDYWTTSIKRGAFLYQLIDNNSSSLKR